MMRKLLLKLCAATLVAASAAAPNVQAADLHVMTSGGFSSADGLRQALLQAKSIAYSDSASGVYIERELFKKLGIEDQVKSKAKMIPRIPVASVVADGEYEIGFQQVSELLPVEGATFVGKIPESVQSVTRFAAGIPVGARHPKEAKALLDYLASPGVQAEVNSTGLDSVSDR